APVREALGGLSPGPGEEQASESGDELRAGCRFMRIIVDGVIYSFQRKGGISTYFNELLPRVGRLPEAPLDLLVPRECSGTLPRGPVITWYPDRPLPSLVRWTGWSADQWLAPARAKLEGALRCRRLLLRRGAVFHSTFFTQPPWPSMPQVLTVYDMVYERFPH